MSEAQSQMVYDILDRIDAPTGKETVFFPEGANLPKAHMDHKNKMFVANLGHERSVLFGQEISKRYGERYTLLPLQNSYDLVRSDMKFKKMMVDYWIYNREVILEKGEIMSDPVVKEVDGKLQYDGKTIKAEINQSDVVDTLMKAGLFEKPTKAVYHAGISFERGEVSVRSYWDSRVGCFGAYACGPAVRSGGGVAAFVKTGEAVEKPKMRQIAESEYQELLKNSEELKKLKPIIKKFKPYLD